MTATEIVKELREWIDDPEPYVINEAADLIENLIKLVEGD